MRRILTLVAAGLLAATFSAPSALAADNDDIAAATLIESVAPEPYVDTVDVSDATAADTDPVPPCESDATGYTVWWKYVAQETNLYASVQGMDPILSVYTGTPGALVDVACGYGFWPEDTGDNRLMFETVPGQTYWFMVSTWPESEVGDVSLEVGVPPEELIVDLQFVRARFLRSGNSLVTMRLTCNHDAAAWVEAGVEQRVGRIATIRGWTGSDALACGPTPLEVVLDVWPDVGKFKGGAARVYGYAQASDGFWDVNDWVAMAAKLRR